MRRILMVTTMLGAMIAMAELDFEQAPGEPEGMESLFNSVGAAIYARRFMVFINP
ncbi:MAG: hypothetical protein WC340_04630 [Kiritimatiellia bacterium]